MKENDINKIKNLTVTLNKYRDSYYNNQESLVSDLEYDNLFDELDHLEKSTGFIMANSPTQTVGYEVKSKLAKIKHSHPMLSLDKTKSSDDLVSFAKDKECVLSLKLDGLTVLLTYDNGELAQAETRGDGNEGELITHNAKVFENIPLHISYKGKLEVEGEAIIKYDDFEKINSKLPVEEKYKNSRNLVSGSVRQLNSEIAAQRHIQFIAWKVPKIQDTISKYDSFLFRLKFVESLGFDIVPLFTYVNHTSDNNNLEYIIECLKNEATNKGYPIDGLVMTYDNIFYGESLGMTGHHPKHSVAYKFYDESVETILKDIEWTIGKTGVLTPTAVFEPIEIDGTMIEKASLHNVSVMYDLYPHSWHSGLTVSVYKANMIIPQISSVKKEISCKAKRLDPPLVCPVCRSKTEIKQENNSKILVCTNSQCKGKLLGKLTHFVSKNAMNIDGLSEATLEKLVDLGYIESFIDIYELKNNFYKDMLNMEGFGKRSVDKLMDSIEASKNTTLDRFINALSIPLIGRSASKTISKCFDGDYNKWIDAMGSKNDTLYDEFDWSQLEGIGSNMNTEIRNFAFDNLDMIKELSSYMNFQTNNQTTNHSIDLSGKTFVITGSLKYFLNRDVAKEIIESLGGKVAGSVSMKTTYLVNNDVTSTSGKNKKAKELGIPIIDEEELLKMLGMSK